MGGREVTEIGKKETAVVEVAVTPFNMELKRKHQLQLNEISWWESESTPKMVLIDDVLEQQWKQQNKHSQTVGWTN